MPGAYGFVKYPQEPTPDPAAVGMALMQRARQATGPGMDMDPQGEPDMDPDDPMALLRRPPSSRWGL